MNGSVTCASCNHNISKNSINVATDIAQCENCGTIAKLSELVTTNQGKTRSVYDYDKPDGVDFEQTGRGFVISATLRSAMALFLVPFSIVWIGLSLGGIYGSQITEGEFDPVRSLFGIPFLFGSVLLGGMTLLSIFGSLEIKADGYDGTVSTGVGPFRKTKRFSWLDVDSINEGVSDIKINDSPRSNIVLAGKKKISFGSGLSDERRYYILQILKTLRANLH